MPSAPNRERQAAAQLTLTRTGKLDVYKILRFVRSEAFRHICGAEDAAGAGFIIVAACRRGHGCPGPRPARRALPPTPGVLVQGIADIVLVYPDHLELLDYKTDRRKTPADFVCASPRSVGALCQGH